MRYVLKTKRGGELCYLVRVPGTESRLFKPSIFGGEEAAHAAAEAYRLKMVGGHKPGPRERAPRKTNELGIAGVRKKTIRGHDYWIAFWNDKPAHTVYRSFSIDKYGDQTAKAKAIEARSRKT